MDENNLQENQNVTEENGNGKCENYGLAITSMVCGIVSVFFFCFWYIAIILAVLAIIFGTIVLVKNKGPKKGKGMAVAGIICGGFAILISVLVIIGALAFFANFNTDYFSNFQHDF